MTRYFFDVSTNQEVRHDFSGRYFCNLDQAQEHAELIAMDIGCTGYIGPQTEVQLRDEKAQLLFAVPVRSIEALAA